MAQATHAGASPAERRDARLGLGHLHRQDRHADAEPHGDSIDLRARRFVDRRGHERRVRGQPPPLSRMRRVLPRPENAWPATAQRREWIGDPMELALVRMATALGARAFDRTDRRDPVRARAQAAGDRAPRGGDDVLFVKGAPEELLPRARWIDVTGSKEPLTADASAGVRQGGDRDGGSRAARAGLCLSSPSRPATSWPTPSRIWSDGARRLRGSAATGRCRQPSGDAADAGIKVIMVTGDHPHTALAVAREIGLVQSAAPRS